MALTPIDVQQKTFGTALRGYDLDEVDDFLDEVVTTLKSYEEQITRAQERIEALESDLAGRGDSESAISRALVAAQRSADMIVEEAKTEADRILAEAREQNARLASVRDEERAKLDVEVASLRSGISEIREKVKALAGSIESDLDAMDRTVDGGAAGLSTETEEQPTQPSDQPSVPTVPDQQSGAPSVPTVASDDVPPAMAAAFGFSEGEGEEEPEPAGHLDDAIADATFQPWVSETAGGDDDEGWAAPAEQEAEDQDEEAQPAETMHSADDEPDDAWERAGFEGWGDDDADTEKPRRPWE